MKIVIQNVLSSTLKINDEIYSQIGRGYLLLVGFTKGDNEDVVRLMADKLLGLRIFQDEQGLTNLSIKDINGEIMSVSQFTLYADTRKGRRPSFVNALHPSESKPLYEYFNRYLEQQFGIIKTGVFGADMKINLVNDGPFTIILDSEELRGDRK
ncbi:MAG: D-tyrosyl-tRNA(Tyr) deacylase [Bacilli bacterium]|nr:D-tyrosyl-tRNA(Tyr) deacylase [Bacilli bacterium]